MSLFFRLLRFAGGVCGLLSVPSVYAGTASPWYVAAMVGMYSVSMLLNAITAGD